MINRAATAFRLAATTLIKSHSYLGAQYRRLRTRLGAPKAITAMAHKLARLVYRMLKYGHEYVDKGMQYYEKRHRDQQMRCCTRRAAKLGLASRRTAGPVACRIGFWRAGFRSSCCVLPGDAACCCLLLKRFHLCTLRVAACCC